MPRSITLLCLAQFVCLIGGFSFLAMRMRWYGFPGEPIVSYSKSDIAHHWSIIALFLRHAGLYLLALPVTWMLAASISEYRGRLGLPPSGWMLVGVALSLGILATYFYFGYFPFYETRRW